MYSRSQLANILGKSHIDKQFRKDILDMFERVERRLEEAERLNDSYSETVIKLQDENYQLKEKLAEVVTGNPDFGKYAYLVESESYKKLEQIREIVRQDTDWEEFYGEDN
jgi:hypothetical protein